MLLGTHNSWTYGKTKWYIPGFIVRCQNLNIQQQYIYGVRIFDLRVRRKSYGDWGVAHGCAFFNVDLYKDLEWLNLHDDCYVRVILEYNSIPRGLRIIENEFSILCEYLESKFTNIKFFGGNAKWDMKINIYSFQQNLELIDRYSSTISLFKSNNKFLRIIDDWIPIIYAKKFNKKNYNNWINSERNGNLFVDFVELCIR